ncbi:MAG: Membrane alanine aminopeptidase N, partial [uncultured Corynebacteriales bacterium]
GRPQPDPHRRAGPRRAARRDRVRGGARPHRRRRQARRADLPVPDHDPVHRADAGRRDVRRRDSRRLPGGDAQRRPGRHRRLHDRGRAGADRPGRGQRARRRRRLPLHQHRRGPAPLRRPGRRRGLPLLAVRDGRRQADVRLLRPARPQGHLRADGHRAGALGGRLQRPGRGGHRGHRRGAGGAVPHHSPALAVRDRAGRRAVPQGHRQPRRDRPRRLLPRLAGRAPGRGGDPAGHQAGLRLVPPGLRLPVPVRQVRPAVRAGVQRRRDGERGLRHVPGRLRVPVEGHRLQLRAPRRDDPARDGAHVVRRPGHHAVVGRPVAERVVRHVRLGAVPVAGDPVHQRLDDVRQHREDLGVPAGPAVLHAPDRGRHPGPAGRGGQLRRDHLRQGRQRAQAARGVRGDRAVPPGDAGLLPPPRVREHQPRRPVAGAGGGVRPGPLPVVGAVAGDDRRQHAAGRVHPGRPGAVLLLHAGAGAGDRQRRAPGPPPRRRAVRAGRREAGPGRPGRAGRPRRPHRGAGAGRGGPAGPAAGQRRRPDVREGAAGRAVAGHAGGPGRRHRRLAAPGDLLERGLGHDPRRRAAGPRLRRAGAERGDRRDRDRRGAVDPDQDPHGARGVLRPGPGRGRVAPAGGEVAGAGAGGRAGLGPAAGLGAHAGRGDPRPGARRGAARAAGRLGAGAGADRGRRAALDAGVRARRGGGGRRRRDRGRAGAGPDGVRPAPVRDRAGAAAHGRGQGRGVAAGHRGRRPAERDQRGDHRRLRAPGPGGAGRAVPGAVLRGDRRGLGAADLGDRAERRGRAVPGRDVAGGRGRRRDLPGGPGGAAGAAPAGRRGPRRHRPRPGRPGPRRRGRL